MFRHPLIGLGLLVGMPFSGNRFKAVQCLIALLISCSCWCCFGSIPFSSKARSSSRFTYTWLLSQAYIGIDAKSDFFISGGGGSSEVASICRLCYRPATTSRGRLESWLMPLAGRARFLHCESVSGLWLSAWFFCLVFIGFRVIFKNAVSLYPSGFRLFWGDLAFDNSRTN